MTKYTEDAALTWGRSFDKAVPVNKKNNLIVCTKFASSMMRIKHGEDTEVIICESVDIRKLRGKAWNNVITIGIKKQELMEKYTDLYSAIKNGCITNNVEFIEIN